jgi:hypothetical protein
MFPELFEVVEEPVVKFEDEDRTNLEALENDIA